MARAGHNSIDQTVKDRLRSFVDRVERLADEMAALRTDTKEIYVEANSAGFDVKAIKEVVRIRKKDAGDFAEFLAQVNTYRRALGEEEIGL